MKQKLYTNFQVKEDSFTLKTEQQPSKTNHAALEAIRQQQVQPTIPVERAKEAAKQFNEWAANIHQQLKTR